MRTLLISHYSSHGVITYGCISRYNVAGRRCADEEFIIGRRWMYVLNDARHYLSSDVNGRPRVLKITEN